MYLISKTYLNQSSRFLPVWHRTCAVNVQIQTDQSSFAAKRFRDHVEQGLGAHESTLFVLTQIDRIYVVFFREFNDEMETWEL